MKQTAPTVGNVTAPDHAPAATRECRRGCGMGRVLSGVCLVVLCFANHACLRKKGGRGDMVVAMNNGKSMMLALSDFSMEYGSYPDRETAKAVKERTKTELNLDGDTANDYFRQLIAAGVVKSEDPFYSKTPYSIRKPDRLMNGTEALKPGEVGFGYLMNGVKAMPNDDPNRVIAATPLLNATAAGEFDPEPLQGKAALVYLDSSVKMVTIREDNHRVNVSGRKTLLDCGADTIWDTAVTPVIKPPQTPPGWVPSGPNRTAVNWWWLAGACATFTLLALWVILKRKDIAGQPPER
jgi:hypothetical protein